MGAFALPRGTAFAAGAVCYEFVEVGRRVCGAGQVGGERGGYQGCQKPGPRPPQDYQRPTPDTSLPVGRVRWLWRPAHPLASKGFGVATRVEESSPPHPCHLGSLTWDSLRRKDVEKGWMVSRARLRAGGAPARGRKTGTWMGRERGFASPDLLARRPGATGPLARLAARAPTGGRASQQRRRPRGRRQRQRSTSSFSAPPTRGPEVRGWARGLATRSKGKQGRPLGGWSGRPRRSGRRAVSGSIGEAGKGRRGATRREAGDGRVGAAPGRPPTPAARSTASKAQEPRHRHLSPTPPGPHAGTPGGGWGERVGQGVRTPGAAGGRRFPHPWHVRRGREGRRGAYRGRHRVSHGAQNPPPPNHFVPPHSDSHLRFFNGTLNGPLRSTTDTGQRRCNWWTYTTKGTMLASL